MIITPQYYRSVWTPLFQNLQILLDSGSISTILMGNLTSKLKSKRFIENTWETQAEKFTTSNKVNVDLCLPEFSATKIVSWKCQVASSTKSRYDMILGRDLLTDFGLDLKFSENIIMGGDWLFKGCSAPMVDVSIYDFKPLTYKKVKPE